MGVMNFALIVDSCKVESYVVKNNKAYKMKDSDTPYSFHHSIGNESFIGFWGYPFLWDGCFINWSEWGDLPDLDLDVIFIIIERDFLKYKISDLRKKYPNATLYAALKETWNWEQSYQQRIEVYNQCDKVLIPVHDSSLFGGLFEHTKKDIQFLPQPVDTHYLYDNFYREEREEKIFSYFPVHNHSRYGETQIFTEYISKKFNIPFVRTHTQDSKTQWEDFLKLWTPCTFHFNLDPTPQFPGQQAMQCAALGVVHIGGVNDSHEFLWPETATNDKMILETEFVTCLNEYEYRVEMIQNAWDVLDEIYSYNAVRNRFEEMI
jgi:hypothetical protein